MSDADEQIQSDSEVSHEEDSGVEESGTSPIHPSSSNGPPHGMAITNGIHRTPPKRPAPIPPSPDSPLLRHLLASRGQAYPPMIVTSPLQASTSQAIVFVPGDAESSNANVGNASVSVPGIAPAPEDVPQASISASTASDLPGAGEISNTDVGNFPVRNPLPEDVGASVPVPEDVLQSSTSTASNNPGAVEISKTEEGSDSVDIPLPEVVEASGPGVLSQPEAEGGYFPEMIPTPEAAAENNPAIIPTEGESIPEIKQDSEAEGGSVPGAIPSAEAASSNVLSTEVVRDIKPETVSIVETGSCVPETGANAGKSLDLETVSSKEVGTLAYLPASEAKEAGISQTVQNIDADVSEALQFTMTNVPSAVLPAEVDKAPKDENVSKIVMDASVKQDLIPLNENVEKSDQPSQSPKAMEITEPEKCATATEELDQTTKEVAQTESKALELTEGAIETSIPKMYVPFEATAVEFAQASNLTVEAPQTSEPNPESSEEYSQASSSKKTLEPATTGSGPGQTSKPTEESEKVSKPTEEAREVFKPQKSAAPAIEPSQVTEPNEEPMDTSETSGSVQTSESKQEPEKIGSKEEERSPVTRPARGRLEDLKSDDSNTPKSPSRRRPSSHSHSESPSPKKQRRTVRSATSERVPSND
ncbi:hypothetical protein JTE90_003534 [Oedothorax gibbosus]|uniref:Uncharacterized protein n=1 Tax=Oedothorax gibbosus TaxID=931172 RepID=A0AAV6UNZ1_9ARAC|nr:hypothetical protein JTE90_003534 [Oedothorax gibbosus]